jgi:hypothetical protein
MDGFAISVQMRTRETRAYIAVTAVYFVVCFGGLFYYTYGSYFCSRPACQAVLMSFSSSSTKRILVVVIWISSTSFGWALRCETTALPQSKDVENKELLKTAHDDNSKVSAAELRNSLPQPGRLQCGERKMANSR